MMRLFCIVLGHRWVTALPHGPLWPMVVVSWPRLCLRCGARQGL